MTLAGLRPGEKLFEEKLMAEEGLKKTKNKLIHILYFFCSLIENSEAKKEKLTINAAILYEKYTGMGGKRIILSEICLQHGGEHLKVLQIFAGHSY